MSVNEVLALNVRLALEQTDAFVSQNQKHDRISLADFYGKHAIGLYWVDGAGPNQRALALIRELSKAGSWGLEPKMFALPAFQVFSEPRRWTASEQIVAELKIGLALLKYARHARGGRLDPQQLSFDFDRRPELINPLKLLAAVISSDDPAAYLRSLHPQHAQFQRLRSIYAEALVNEFGFDLLSRGTSKKKNHNRRNQRSLSRADKLKKIHLNMELWRWMPTDLGKRYVWANIPEYKVRVINEDSVVHHERMIVGKTRHKTPIFTDEMESIVFQPYWAVPNSIKIKELLPKLLRGSSLGGLKISKSLGGREINPYAVNWRRTDIRNYVVYQPPGRRNALGKVKFLFPNRHAIYFHDTPGKSLFNRSSRAFSHGCMRVRNPMRLAEVLLSSDRGWRQSTIKQLSTSGPQNNVVRLNRKVPVHVTYFTARVSHNGRMLFFDDLYGHERLLQLGLAGQLSNLSKPVREDLANVRSQIIANAGTTGGTRARRRNLIQLSASQRSGLGATNLIARPQREGLRLKPVTRRVRRPARLDWRRSVYGN